MANPLGLTPLPMFRLPRLGQDTSIDPEEEEGILGRVMGGLETAGNILDTPRAMVWHGLSGHNPFEVANPFDPAAVAARPTGWDLMRNLGIEGQEGFDWTDVPAVASEVVGDPLLWLRGPKAAVSAAGLAAKSAAGPKTLGEGLDLFSTAASGGLTRGKVLGSTAASTAEEIRRGERALGAIKTPFSNSPGFTFNFGLSPQSAGNLYEQVQTGKYSPIAWLRSSLGPVSGGYAPGAEMVQHQLAHSNYLNQMAIAKETLPLFEQGLKDMGPLWESVGKYAQTLGGQEFANMEDFIRYVGETRQVMEETASVAGRKPSLGPEGIAGLFGSQAPAEAVEDIAGRAYQLADYHKQLNNVIYDRVGQLGGPHPILNDYFVEHMARHGTKIPKDVKPEVYMRLVRATMPESLQREAILKMPGGTAMVNTLSRDPLISGTGSLTKQESGIVQGAILKYLQAENPVTYGRILQDPDAYGTLSRIQEAYIKTRYLDPEMAGQVSAGAIGPEDAAKWGKAFLDGFAPSVGVEAKEPLLKHLTAYLAKLPAEVRETGVFGQGLMKDWISYQEHGAIAMANLMAAHSLIKKTANISDSPNAAALASGNGKTTLDKAWDAAVVVKEGKSHKALTDEGLVTAVRDILGQEPIESLASLEDEARGAIVREAKEGASRIIVDEKLSDVLSRYIDIQSPESNNVLMKIYDGFNAAFRKGVTKVWPAFHVRNRVSGFWQNAQRANTVAGGETYSIGQLLKAEKDIAKTALGSPAEEAILKLEFGKEFLANGEALGIKSIGKQFDERAVEKPVVASMAGPLKALFGKAREPGTGLKGVAKSVASVPDQLYGYVEFANRYPPFAAAMANGKSAAQAAALVNEIQYNYARRPLGALPSALSYKMNRVIPFFSWSSQNIPYNLSMLINYPGGAQAQSLRFMNRASQGSSDYVPSWMREQVGIRTGGTEEEASFIRGFGLPIEELGSIVFKDGNPVNTRTLERFAGMLAPPIQLPLKALAQKDFFTGRPTKELKGPLPDWFPGKQNIEQMLSSSPLSRGVSTFASLADERKTPLQKAMNLFTGIKTGTYNLPQQKTYELQDAINRELQESPVAREFSRFYVPKEKQSTADPEVLRRLAQLNALEKERAKQSSAAGPASAGFRWFAGKGG